MCKFNDCLRDRIDVKACGPRWGAETRPQSSRTAGRAAPIQRFEEAKALLRTTIPVARRAFGESHELVLKMRCTYAETLYVDPNATLDDLREAVTTLEDAGRIARRVFGGAHPITAGIEEFLRNVRAVLRDTPPTSN